MTKTASSAKELIALARDTFSRLEKHATTRTSCEHLNLALADLESVITDGMMPDSYCGWLKLEVSCRRHHGRIKAVLYFETDENFMLSEYFESKDHNTKKRSGSIDHVVISDYTDTEDATFDHDSIQSWLELLNSILNGEDVKLYTDLDVYEHPEALEYIESAWDQLMIDQQREKIERVFSLFESLVPAFQKRCDMLKASEMIKTARSIIAGDEHYFENYWPDTIYLESDETNTRAGFRIGFDGISLYISDLPTSEGKMSCATTLGMKDGFDETGYQKWLTTAESIISHEDLKVWCSIF